MAREIVRAAIATVFDGHAVQTDTRPVIAWFERGGAIDLSDISSAADVLAAVEPIDGFDRVAKSLGANDRDQDGTRAAIADFILEGLCALKKISRTDSGRLHAAPGAATPRERGDERTLQSLMDEDETPVKGRRNTTTEGKF